MENPYLSNNPEATSPVFFIQVNNSSFLKITQKFTKYLKILNSLSNKHAFFNITLVFERCMCYEFDKNWNLFNKSFNKRKSIMTENSDPKFFDAQLTTNDKLPNDVKSIKFFE